MRGQRSEEPTLKKLAEKHGKTPAQVLLRWSLQKVRHRSNMILEPRGRAGTAESELTVVVGVRPVAEVGHEIKDRGECRYIRF